MWLYGKVKRHELKICYTNMFLMFVKFIGVVDVKLVTGNYCTWMGTKEFKPSEGSSHSNYRCLHQRLLSTVS